MLMVLNFEDMIKQKSKIFYWCFINRHAILINLQNLLLLYVLTIYPFVEPAFGLQKTPTMAALGRPQPGKGQILEGLGHLITFKKKLMTRVKMVDLQAFDVL